MSQNWRQSEICIVINDKSQGSIAKYLSCDRLLYCKFAIQFAGKRIFKTSEHLAKLHMGKMIDRITRCVRLKDAEPAG